MKKQAFNVVLILVVALLGAGSVGADDSAAFEKQLAKAQSLATEGKHAKAAKAYSRADALAEGTSAEALLGHALASYRSGGFEDCLASAHRLVQVAESDELKQAGNHLLGLATVSIGTEDSELLATAEEAFTQALSLSKGKVFGAHLGLAEIYAIQGKNEETFAAARRFLMLDPKSPSANAARVLACQAQQKLGPTDRTAEDFLPPQDGLEYPKRIHQPPGNPPRLKGAFDLWIDEMGCVVNVEFAEGTEPDEEIREYLLGTVYSPGSLNGKDAAVLAAIEVKRGVTAATIGAAEIQTRIDQQGQ